MSEDRTDTAWPPLLSDHQVAAYLGGVSRAIVWRWASAGKLPTPIHLPGRVSRWVRSDLDDAIAQWAREPRRKHGK